MDEQLKSLKAVLTNLSEPQSFAEISQIFLNYQSLIEKDIPIAIKKELEQLLELFQQRLKADSLRLTREELTAKEKALNDEISSFNAERILLQTIQNNFTPRFAKALKRYHQYLDPQQAIPLAPSALAQKQLLITYQKFLTTFTQNQQQLLARLKLPQLLRQQAVVVENLAALSLNLSSADPLALLQLQQGISEQFNGITQNKLTLEKLRADFTSLLNQRQIAEELKQTKMRLKNLEQDCLCLMNRITEDPIDPASKERLDLLFQSATNKDLFLEEQCNKLLPPPNNYLSRWLSWQKPVPSKVLEPEQINYLILLNQKTKKELEIKTLQNAEAQLNDLLGRMPHSMAAKSLADLTTTIFNQFFKEQTKFLMPTALLAEINQKIALFDEDILKLKKINSLLLEFLKLNTEILQLRSACNFLDFNCNYLPLTAHAEEELATLENSLLKLKEEHKECNDCLHMIEDILKLSNQQKGHLKREKKINEALLILGKQKQLLLTKEQYEQQLQELEQKFIDQFLVLKQLVESLIFPSDSNKMADKEELAEIPLNNMISQPQIVFQNSSPAKVLKNKEWQSTFNVLYEKQQFFQKNYPLEADLLQELIDTFYQIALDREQGLSSQAIRASLPDLNASRYECLYRHRGFFMILQKLAELAVYIQAALSAEPAKDYRHSFFYCRTHTAQLLEDLNESLTLS